jgi:hypothetical protein
MEDSLARLIVATQQHLRARRTDERRPAVKNS